MSLDKEIKWKLRERSRKQMTLSNIFETLEYYLVSGFKNIIRAGSKNLLILGSNNDVKAVNSLVIGSNQTVEDVDGAIITQKLFVDGQEFTKDTGKIIGYKDGLPTPDAGQYPIVFDETESVHKAWNGNKWQPMYINE